MAFSTAASITSSKHYISYHILVGIALLGRRKKKMKEAREQKRILMLPFGIYSLFKQADRSDGFMKILGDKDHPSYLDRSEIPILQVGM